MPPDPGWHTVTETVSYGLESDRAAEVATCPIDVTDCTEGDILNGPSET